MGTLSPKLKTLAGKVVCVSKCGRIRHTLKHIYLFYLMLFNSNCRFYADKIPSA